MVHTVCGSYVYKGDIYQTETVQHNAVVFESSLLYCTLRGLDVIQSKGLLFSRHFTLWVTEKKSFQRFLLALFCVFRGGLLFGLIEQNSIQPNPFQ